MKNDARCDQSRSIEILRIGIALSVSGAGPIAPLPDPMDVDWAAVARLGMNSKLLVQAANGLRRIGYSVSEGFRAEENGYRKFILAMNGLNLKSLSDIAALLRQGGVEYILFKGPVGQHDAYGVYFQRPSSDVDILVDRRNFPQCRALLEQAGYALPAECDRIWWRSFLGEQHFFSVGQRRATVDLHHRLQQPGCPHPRNVGAFLADVATHRLNGVDIPCISLIHATLLASLSFVKSLVQHCHAAAYLADFSALLLRLSPAERLELHRRAVAQDVEHSLCVALSCAWGMFAVRVPELTTSIRVERLFGDDLARVIFTPDDPAIVWPRLRQLLWALCDNGRPGQRLSTYIRVGGSFLASKIARKLPAPRAQAGGFSFPESAIAGLGHSA
ncbi:nucleotidyltransferase family protein [Sphingobium sp.]|uniref:nucleotidyltransferase family protein n=2 Tax=Sphingobium TaxID=165695 RepID=UPI002580B423|nr:nucleotidyltransferase family protein [Sphingobium sp.]MBR2269701.1 nucleotidyltransferase family protein [Sphingobium sp.]